MNLDRVILFRTGLLNRFRQDSVKQLARKPHNILYVELRHEDSKMMTAYLPRAFPLKHPLWAFNNFRRFQCNCYQFSNCILSLLILCRVRHWNQRELIPPPLPSIPLCRKPALRPHWLLKPPLCLNCRRGECFDIKAKKLRLLQEEVTRFPRELKYTQIKASVLCPSAIHQVSGHY